MDKLTDLKPPDDLDWHIWLDRHDRMQEPYIMMRDERFQLIARLISETQEHPLQVFDLGCTAGALMLSTLEAWERQRAEVHPQDTGQDVDDRDGFWEGSSKVLRVDISEIHGRLYGGHTAAF